MSDLVGNPKDRFSHDAAHIICAAVAAEMLIFSTFELSSATCWLFSVIVQARLCDQKP